ncbi:MAG: sugar phosphate isomerase/epimerase [Ruminococcaceae bacterium]|nr:sugar phosphate isomerase/epimerase [Oscillospiraceae bacterium]
MKNRIIMHINYAESGFGSFGKRSIDDICRFAAETGFDGIEFRGALPKELASLLSFREYAEQIAKGKKKYGLSEILFGIGTKECINPDNDVRERDIAETVEKAKIAREVCGSEVCNTYSAWINSPIPTVPKPGYEFHGSAAATSTQWEMIADAYRRIAVELEKIGLRFAFETHMNYVHDLPTQAKKLVDMINSPAVGINMDYGNTFLFPERPTFQEAIDLYGDKLFYAHLKNYITVPGASKKMPTALSDGEINHRAYLEKLHEVGFTGPIAIEAPRPGDRLWFAKYDLFYVKQLMKEI